MLSVARSLRLSSAVAALAFLTTAAAQITPDAFTFREQHYVHQLGLPFETPETCVISPDGKHVYFVIAGDGYTILLFERNEDDGTLELSDTIQMLGPDNVSGTSLQSQAMSVDGRFLYSTIGRTPNSVQGVVCFRRNANNGRLTPVEIFPGTTGFPHQHLLSPFRLFASPDGRNLYVSTSTRIAGVTGQGLTVLSTDPATGAMSAVQSLRDDPNVVDGLDTVIDIDIPSDGLNLYVVSLNTGNLGVYARDPDTGTVTRIDGIEFNSRGGEAVFITSVAISPDDRHVYVAVAREESGVIHTYARDADGLLSLESTISLPSTGSRSFLDSTNLVTAPDGLRIYGVSELSLFSAFARDEHTGALSVLETFEEYRGPVLPVFVNPWNFAVSADSRHLYFPVSGNRSFATFAVERPELPCEDFPDVMNQFEAFAQAYDLYEDLDRDGLPELASIALLKEAACRNIGDEFDEAVTDAYLINLNSVDFETAPKLGADWEPYRQGMAGLLLISRAMELYLNEELSPLNIDVETYYLAVVCEGDDCDPSRSLGTAARAADEPLSGEGDPDEDGFTNAEEWANVLARGGSVEEFAISALDPLNDGTIEVDVGGGGGGGGGCFIATAAYGTPLAAELDTLRDFRDTRLLTNPLGTAFADAYYRLSPPIAEYIADRPRIRALAHALLKPVLLRANGDE